jgi:hypothetical protein
MMAGLFAFVQATDYLSGGVDSPFRGDSLREIILRVLRCFTKSDHSE